MSSRTILITGGAGFIGSNFIPFFLGEHQGISVVNLDKLTYAGNLQHLEDVKDNERYKFVQGDICDVDLVKSIFAEYQISDVIHFAAESHVDNSIEGPEAFIKTNINGTFTLLEAARKHWFNSANSPKKQFESSRFHHISTDEVYGSLGESGFFDEDTAYAPNSPYSASKAASDFLVRSYFHTYGLNVVTSNCSNNYGPKQHDEKLIPTIIRKALAGEDIPIYGDGKNVRDWLYVLDHCTGIGAAFSKGEAGETYVIGGDNEHNNISIAKAICTILDQVHPKENGSYGEQITFVKDRLGHDFRYAIDARKIKTELGWEPQFNFDAGLKKTVSWYLSKYQKS
ncbi:dTDP-glucose 4,6-dehydratase [Zobellia roscoffensis]|uniref:dTDP-glucose 4,6-dehydratase n=1 Tax=Zobellia roscoffensis TaxID=2779508 RepID=UPI00188DC18C|nr:dTDP-glucose 4,6-dehydratase [Zobellia roscoffensis]